MRVWQPGSHLSMQRGAEVSDWTWRRTARRITTLARLAAPYKRQTTLAIASLLAATLISLAPPYLAKLAVDAVDNGHSTRSIAGIVVLFLAAGIGALVATSAQTYFTGWTGERILADLRNRLFKHLNRLSLGYF